MLRLRQLAMKFWGKAMPDDREEKKGVSHECWLRIEVG
jgi:hypothetical protein